MIRRFAAVCVLLFAPAAFAGDPIPAWVRSAIPAELPAAGDANAQVLLDERVMTIGGMREMTLRHRRVVKVLTAAGKDEAILGVPFDGEMKIRSMSGWSIDPAGRTYFVRERDAVETSLIDFELYSDTRMKLMKVPADIGSIVAFEYERTERPHLPQDVWHFQENVPVLLARYQVVASPEWKAQPRWINHDAVEPVATNTWEVRSVPALLDEPRRPSSLTIAGRVGFDFLLRDAKPASWSDIARWFSSLALSRSTPTPQVTAKVRELTKDDDDPMRTLARFAQRDVRYVAVEIGIGGYQPHAAGDVLANKYGDCKDKVTLLRTMLKEAGLDAHYVLVHATRGAADPALPTMAAFNHVIAAIPVSAQQAKSLTSVIDHPKLGKLLLFDPTSTVTPFGQLPESLQASRGLLVTPDGGEMIELPAHTPEVNQLHRIAKLRLDPDGTLSGSVTETRTGTTAAATRAAIAGLNATDRASWIASIVGSHLTVSKVTNVAIEFLDEPESDLVIRYDISARDYARRAGDMLLIRPRVLGQKAETLIDLKRTYAYVTEGPSLHRDEIEIALPPAVKLDELPAKVEIQTPLVQYASASTFADGVLRYQRRYSMNAFAIPRESLAELNGAWKQILGDERASAVFK